MRTFYLSFAGEEGFRGACLIDVTTQDARLAKIEIDVLFPHHGEDAEWIAAAAEKARREGCNPGGEIFAVDVTGAEAEYRDQYPRNHLLSKADLEAYGPIERVGDD